MRVTRLRQFQVTAMERQGNEEVVVAGRASWRKPGFGGIVQVADSDRGGSARGTFLCVDKGAPSVPSQGA